MPGATLRCPPSRDALRCALPGRTRARTCSAVFLFVPAAQQAAIGYRDARRLDDSEEHRLTRDDVDVPWLGTPLADHNQRALRQRSAPALEVGSVLAARVTYAHHARYNAAVRIRPVVVARGPERVAVAALVYEAVAGEKLMIAHHDVRCGVGLRAVPQHEVTCLDHQLRRLCPELRAFGLYHDHVLVHR